MSVFVLRTWMLWLTNPHFQILLSATLLTAAERAGSELVVEPPANKKFWKGRVDVFDIIGYREARRCYA